MKWVNPRKANISIIENNCKLVDWFLYDGSIDQLRKKSTTMPQIAKNNRRQILHPMGNLLRMLTFC